MVLQQVTVSGTVGKQVYASGPSGRPSILNGLTLTPSGANARVVIRDGNASGTIVFHASAPSAFGSKDFEFEGNGFKFSHGMHVKVLGTNAQAYLYLD